MDFKIEIPEYAVKVLNNLEACGFEAFVVGGCVRDCLMNKTPYDWDICTNALPHETISVFENKLSVIPTGIKHGTVTIISDGKPIEVTTYRADAEYDDCRHPSEVKFLADIREDLARRDFTINAMAYNQKVGIVDLFGGQQDIKDRILRCVGDANLRFCEDALRIMRALRFGAVCDLTISVDTKTAIRQNKKLLKNIAVERIYTELKKLLAAKEPSRIMIDYRDVLAEIIPEVFDNEALDKQLIKSVDTLPADSDLRLTAILYSVSNCRDILARLKTDKDIRRRVSAVKRMADEDVPRTKTDARHLLKDNGKTAVCDWLLINGAIKKDKRYSKAFELVEEIICNGECYELSSLAVNGGDLISLGRVSGKGIGEKLNELLEAVIDEKVKNEKNSLLTYIVSKEN